MVYGMTPPEVHVKGEIHEFIADFPDGENIKRHPDRHGRAPVLGSHPPVVPNLFK